jgi:hypothetical protein
MACDWHGSLCSPHSPMVIAASVIAGMFVPMGTAWAVNGGTFRRDYMFAGPELAAGALVAAAGVAAEFVQKVICKMDGHTLVQQIETMSAHDVASLFLVFVMARIFLYCRNQRNRARLSELSLSRGLRNALTGSVSFTLTTLTLQSWAAAPK